MSNLIGAWTCSEGTGTTAADSSGNGHTLTLGTGMGWGTGHTPYASGMQATNVTGDGAVMGGAFTSPTVATIMAWVNPTDLTAGTTRPFLGLFSTTGGGSSEFALWGQRATFGTPNVYQGNARISGLNALNGSALTAGTFAHCAMTYDGTTAILYLNGSQVTSVSASGTLTAGTAFQVGGVSTGAGDNVINDVRFYSTALTGAQIVTCMNTPVSTSPDPTSGVASTASLFVSQAVKRASYW